jgi:hypothetical protein
MTLMRIFCLLLAINRPALSGSAPAAEEYQVKGAFLLNFAKFVAWPASAFKGLPTIRSSSASSARTPSGRRSTAPRRMPSPANDPFKSVPIQGFQQLGSCHIVFASSAERKRVRGIFDALQGGAVLSVGESEGFLSTGGMIAFKVEGEKVRIEINQQAAERAGLRISAKLLSLAQAGRR